MDAMNGFRDGGNPYESPGIIQAELAHPEREKLYRPPRPSKPWPPFFAFFWIVFGPFICLGIFRYGYRVGLFTFEDDAVYAMFYLVSGVLWLTAGARVMIWLGRSLFAG